MSRIDQVRRRVFLSALAGVAVTLPRRDAFASPPEIIVYRSNDGGCCLNWTEHLQAHGLQVRTHAVDDLEPVKIRLGVPVHLRSCHTALIDSYVVEGHVPAADIKRVLIEQPGARGLAVPGHPAGAPGVAQEIGRRGRFAVILFADGGRERVFARY